MSAQQHPQYKDERRWLDDVLTYIRGELGAGSSLEAHAASSFAAGSIVAMRVAALETLQRALNEPYFGRVDWQVDGEDSADTYYVGKQALPKQNIFAWQDTLASDLYYQRASKRTSGKLLLKRAIAIEDEAIKRITDEYVDPSLGEQLTAYGLGDEYLTKLLAKNRGGKLHDIVVTILARQDELIRLPHNQILIIQGVPGSGKTTLALHRLSYLLYQDTLKMRASDVLVLGPNRVFMQYVSGVLPDLGDIDVPQFTFDEWARRTLDMEHEAYQSQEAALEQLLDPALGSTDRARLYRSTFLKGSLKMGTLIDRYVDQLATTVLADKEPLRCVYEGYVAIRTPGDNRRVQVQVGTILNAETLATVFEQARAVPYNQRRDEIERRLVRAVVRDLERKSRNQLAQRNLQESDLNSLVFPNDLTRAVETQIHQYFGEWPAVNTAVAYRRLLRTPALLRSAGTGLFSTWDLELLHQDAPKAGTRFQFADLAALLYLETRLNGAPRIYHHIVVDEAQDLTPLLFKTLRGLCRDHSMTVLGDLDQGIYAHHGIAAWRDLQVADDEQPATIEIIRESYRSTREIIEFANAVLQRSGAGEERLAQPINRRGTAPSLVPCTDDAAVATTLSRMIAAERKAGHGSIAVLAKTTAACERIDQLLRRAGVASYQRIHDRDDEYWGGVALLPVYLAKGLEFDAVIIADADANSYPADDIHARLLYVSITRAAHSLQVCWVGQPSWLLVGGASFALPLFSPLAANLAARPVRIADYTARYPQHRADWIVERLAAAEKLDLLPGGQIDEVLLDTLVASALASSDRDDELTVVPLPEAEQQELARAVNQLAASGTPTGAQSVALLQLSYGLLNNHLRATGVHDGDNDERAPEQQAIELATLLTTLRETGADLGGGRWTTRQRTLGLVAGPQRALADQQLALLVQEGVVEQQTIVQRAQEGTGEGQPARQRTQIRIQADWIVAVLELALGLQPQGLDSDVISQLQPLKQPLAAFGGAA